MGAGMTIFDAEELAQVADTIPAYFQDDISPETEESILFLADSMLKIISSTRSIKEKRKVVADFIKMSVCSGQLIQARRIALDGLLWRSNTHGLDN